MAEPGEILFGIMEGRHRAQILYSGVKLGVFDAVSVTPRSSSAVAADLGVNDEFLYRLLRALASMAVLEEHPDRRFSLTGEGELLRADHPESLRPGVLLEEGPEHYAIWRHLPDIVREGTRSGFLREFGKTAFEYAEENPRYAAVFHDAMSSFSLMLTPLALEALKDYDFSSISHICDVGGGHGHMLGAFLQRYEHLTGSVLELPSVLQDEEALWAKRMGVADRCRYIAGDMFEQAPAADAYMMKLVLHDWSDEECVRILRRLHEAAATDAHVFIFEHLVSGPGQPHPAKIIDIHMMCICSGRERTPEEFGALLEQAGWRHVSTLPVAGGMFGAVVGRKP
jgi:hypothetical protein